MLDSVEAELTSRLALEAASKVIQRRASPLYLPYTPYISPISPRSSSAALLTYISPIPPLYLPYISPISPLYLTMTRPEWEGGSTLMCPESTRLLSTCSQG